MRTKNAKAITRAESAHMARVKESGCAVFGAGGIGSAGADAGRVVCMKRRMVCDGKH